MSELKRWHIWLIGCEKVVLYYSYPLSEQSYELLMKLLEFVRPALTSDFERVEIDSITDVGPCGARIQ